MFSSLALSGRANKLVGEPLGAEKERKVSSHHSLIYLQQVCLPDSSVCTVMRGDGGPISTVKAAMVML